MVTGPWRVLSRIVICFNIVVPGTNDNLIVVSERFVVSASVAVNWGSSIVR